MRHHRRIGCICICYIWYVGQESLTKFHSILPHILHIPILLSLKYHLWHNVENYLYLLTSLQSKSHRSFIGFSGLWLQTKWQIMNSHIAESSIVLSLLRGNSTHHAMYNLLQIAASEINANNKKLSIIRSDPQITPLW